MIFERFEDEGLAHFSYAVGSAEAGEVVVVDPRRDTDVYLEWARDNGLRIGRVAETHIHADYASGARELAERAGATLHLSAHDRGERYEVSFDHEALRDGEELRVGAVRLKAVLTPGHTPEHLSFLVHEGEATAPARLLSGDFLFIGSVGRPDLLGEDVERSLAGELYDSLRRVIDPLPDDVRVHPAHGSGSMCGSGMSDTPERALGQERRENPFLDPALDRDAFIDRLLADTPPRPDYYLRMKNRNAGGEALFRPWPQPVALSPAAFASAVEGGAVVVDTRHQLAFGGSHIPGALGIGLDPDLSTWAGWVAPYDRPLVLVLESEGDLEEVVTRLARVGLDRVDGYLEGGMDAWIRDSRPLQPLPQLSTREVLDRRQTLTVLDVRTQEEWEEGHIEGAIHVMGGHLQDRLEVLPDRQAEVAVLCGSGYRSTVAASILQRHGFRQVRNVPGGMDAWDSEGLPVVSEPGSED